MCGLTLLALQAAASPLGVSFVTAGKFGSGTPNELSYAPTSFAGAMAGDGNLSLSNLGQILLAAPSDLETFHGQTFTLQLQFAPAFGVAGPVAVTGTLHGADSENSSGKLQIHFNPAIPTLVHFSNSGASGTFALFLDNLRGVESGSSGTLTGRLSLNPTASTGGVSTEAAVANPEPGSWLLAGSALVALSLLTRRIRVG